MLKSGTNIVYHVWIIFCCRWYKIAITKLSSSEMVSVWSPFVRLSIVLRVFSVAPSWWISVDIRYWRLKSNSKFDDNLTRASQILHTDLNKFYSCGRTYIVINGLRVSKEDLAKTTPSSERSCTWNNLNNFPASPKLKVYLLIQLKQACKVICKSEAWFDALRNT